MEVLVSYKKGKQKFKKQTWIVTKYPIHEVLIYDLKTKDRLEEEFYGKTYKGEKSMIILEVLEDKIVGHGIENLYE